MNGAPRSCDATLLLRCKPGQASCLPVAAVLRPFDKLRANGRRRRLLGRGQFGDAPLLQSSPREGWKSITPPVDPLPQGEGRLLGDGRSAPSREADTSLRMRLPSAPSGDLSRTNLVSTVRRLAGGGWSCFDRVPCAYWRRCRGWQSRESPDRAERPVPAGDEWRRLRGRCRAGRSGDLLP